MSKAVRLRVNPILCDGNGRCAELFPEAIRLDDWGYPIVESADVPRDLLPEAKRAATNCPMLALRLVSADGSPKPAGRARPQPR